MIRIFLNGGHVNDMKTGTLRLDNAHVLARQMSECAMVHTVRVIVDGYRDTDYRNGEDVTLSA